MLVLCLAGDHVYTFGGNPLGSAVAQTALDVIVKEKLVQNSAKLGEYMLKKLRAMQSPHIQEVRGRGLFIGVEIQASSGKARPFCERLKEMGVLAKETHDQVIRLAPPLIIKKREIDWILERIKNVLEA